MLRRAQETRSLPHTQTHSLSFQTYTLCDATNHKALPILHCTMTAPSLLRHVLCLVISMKKVFHSEEDYLQKFLGKFCFSRKWKKSNKETVTNRDILPKFIFISIKNKNYGIFYNKKKTIQNKTKKVMTPI